MIREVKMIMIVDVVVDVVVDVDVVDVISDNVTC